MNARQAWMALPRSTRRRAASMASRGRAHPDPAVRRAAAEWGRYAPRLFFLRLWGSIAAAVVVVPLASVAVGWGVYGVFAGGVLTLVAMGVETYVQHREVHSGMLGPVNGLALLLEAGDAEPLEVGRGFAARFQAAGYLLVGVVGAATAWYVWSLPVTDRYDDRLRGSAPLVALIFTYLAGQAAWQAARRPRPPLRIDGDGLTMPHLGWTVPWGAIESCGLRQRRGSRDRYGFSAPVVVWRLREDGAVSTITDAGRRAALTTWLRAREFTVEISSGQMTEWPERVVALSQLAGRRNAHDAAPR
jgi:hypothetical protein